MAGQQSRQVRRMPLCALVLFAVATSAAAAPEAGDPDFRIFVSGRDSKQIVGNDPRTDEIAAVHAAPGVPALLLVAGKQKCLITVTRAPNTLSVFDLGTATPAASFDRGFEVTSPRLAPDGATLAAAGPANSQSRMYRRPRCGEH